MEKMEQGRIQTDKNKLVRFWYQLREDSIDWFRFSISIIYSCIWAYLLIMVLKAFSAFITSSINPALKDNKMFGEIYFIVMWAAVLLYAISRIDLRRKYERKDYIWIPKERQDSLDKYV
jgi:hypothetical protein